MAFQLYMVSKMAKLQPSRLAGMSGRIEFVTYGLIVHLLLLPTLLRCSSVTFGYRTMT